MCLITIPKRTLLLDVQCSLWTIVELNYITNNEIIFKSIP